jgi:hypothetical protein
MKTEIERELRGLELKVRENYEKIKFQYKTEYDFPELDPIRFEICRCILIGCYQSAITMTNHLLENSLKTTLIYNELLLLKPPVSEFYRTMEQIAPKYDSLILWDSIKLAFENNLITEQQKELLKIFKDDYRNAFSHAEKKKIFKEEKTSIDKVALVNNSIVVTETIEMEKSKFLLTQGIEQAIKAEREAIPYFLEIDSIIRQILTKLDNKKK